MGPNRHRELAGSPPRNGLRPGMSRSRLARARSHIVFDRISAILLAVFVILAIVTALVTYRFIREQVGSWEITNLPGLTLKQPTPTTDPNLSVPQPTLPSGPLQPVEGPAAIPWDKTRPVTILIMGLDYRDWQAGEGPPRTDTMMLLSYDPIHNTAGVLSIPRDMWVNIPGYDYGKINTAYAIGEGSRLPGGGPGLAVKTVEQFLGMPINYYAQIDFDAFVKFVDHIGGVKVHVTEPMTIDPIGDSPKVHLEPGVYTLNGELALAYARSRKTEGGDFDRAGRQQEVILALRDRILQFDLLPGLLAKAPSIYKDISAGIHTNMTFDEALSLGLAVYNLPKENIRMGVIGPQAVEFAKSPDGLDILIPIPDKVRLIRDEIFTAGGPLGPTLGGDLKSQMQAEGATVSVENGTYVAGLAERTGDFLISNGVNVTLKTNAQARNRTAIYIYDATPATAAYIKQLMQMDNILVVYSYDPDAAVDIAVVLGDDWAADNPMP